MTTTLGQTQVNPLGVDKIMAAFSALDRLGDARRALRLAAHDLRAMDEASVASQVSKQADDLRDFEQALQGLLRDEGQER